MKILPGDEGLEFPRYIAVKSSPKKSKSSHDELQELAEQYCNENGISFLHIPDEMLKFIYAPFLGSALQKNQMLYGWLQNVRKAISEYLLGVPDLILYAQKNGLNTALGVELKTGSGKQRTGQLEFAEKFETIVCRDIESFKEVADKFNN